MVAGVSPRGVCLGERPSEPAGPSAEIQLKGPKQRADYLRVEQQRCQELNQENNSVCVCVSSQLICSTSKYCDINHVDVDSHSEVERLNSSDSQDCSVCVCVCVCVCAAAADP